MRQIIKSFATVSQPVKVSICEHSDDRISWLIFAKIGTDVRTPKSKNEFVMGQYHTPFPYFAPKTSILGQELLKIHANIK